MKINILSPPPNLSGGARVVAIYATGLAKRGHDVEIICSSAPRKTIRTQLKNLLARGITFNRSGSMKSHYENYSAKWRVTNSGGPIGAADVSEGEIVLATFWPTAYWARDLPLSKGKRVYLVQHDDSQVSANSREADETYRLPFLQVCVSDWIASEVARRHPRARQVVIPNSVDSHVFRPSEDTRSRDVRVGFMYSEKTWKGADIALAAIRIAREQLPELRCELFGTNIPSGLPDWCFPSTMPDQNELRAIYCRCRAWLFSSRVEGFGLPILEAMACGTPVIATPAGAAPELLRRGGGVLVPHEDPQAMADAIVSVCKKPEVEWASLSNTARHRVASYTWDTATDRLEEVLLAETKRGAKSTSKSS